MMLKVLIILILIALFFYIINLRKGYIDMAVVYVTLIVKGLKTLEDVPVKIQKQVEALLNALEV